MGCLRKLISLIYELLFWWNLVSFKIFESGIQQTWGCNKQTSLAQDIQVRMVEGQNLQNARLVLEGYDFHAFFFFFHIWIEGYGCYIFNTTRIIWFWPPQLKFCVKHWLNVKSANIQHGLEHGLNFISKLLLFKSYIQKYLQNIIIIKKNIKTFHI